MNDATSSTTNITESSVVHFYVLEEWCKGCHFRIRENLFPSIYNNDWLLDNDNHNDNVSDGIRKLRRIPPIALPSKKHECFNVSNIVYEESPTNSALSIDNDNSNKASTIPTIQSQTYSKCLTINASTNEQPIQLNNNSNLSAPSKKICIISQAELPVLKNQSMNATASTNCSDDNMGNNSLRDQNLEPDPLTKSPNLVFNKSDNQNFTRSPRKIRAATLFDIVFTCIEVFDSEGNFQSNELNFELPRIFFSMYRWYISPCQLLDIFQDIYDQKFYFCQFCQSYGGQLQIGSSNQSERNFLYVFTLKFAQVIRYWIKSQPQDFDTNARVKRKLNLLKDKIAVDWGENAKPYELMDHLNLSLKENFWWAANRSKSVKPNSACKTSSMAVAPRNDEKGNLPMRVVVDNPDEKNVSYKKSVSLAFNSIEPHVLANHFTYLDYQESKKISIEEFHKYALYADLNKCPNLRSSIAFFNSLSHWIQCMVLNKTTPQERAKVINKFIDVAKRLYEIHSYNVLMAIVGGLLHSSIARLSKTMAQVYPESLRTLSTYAEVLSATNNFKKYRTEFRNFVENSIPHHTDLFLSKKAKLKRRVVVSIENMTTPPPPTKCPRAITTASTIFNTSSYGSRECVTLRSGNSRRNNRTSLRRQPMVYIQQSSSSSSIGRDNDKTVLYQSFSTCTNDNYPEESSFQSHHHHRSQTCPPAMFHRPPFVNYGGKSPMATGMVGHTTVSSEAEDNEEERRLFRIPIWGVYLKDIVSIHTSFEDYLYGPQSKLVNLPKMVKLFAVCNELSRLKKTRRRGNDDDVDDFAFPVDMDLVNTLRLSLDMQFSEEEIYELSLARETRQINESLSDSILSAGSHIDLEGNGSESSSVLVELTIKPTSFYLQCQHQHDSRDLLTRSGKSVEGIGGGVGRIQRSNTTLAAGHQVFAEWAAGIKPAPDWETLNQHINAMVDAVFKNYDSDRDGCISREEFRSISENFPFIDSFVDLDTDQDGVISKNELKSYFYRANCHAFRRGFKHEFHETTYFKLTFCVHCAGLLWGLIKQGYRCKDCGINAHKSCKDVVVVECRPKQTLAKPATNNANPQRSFSFAGSDGKRKAMNPAIHPEAYSEIYVHQSDSSHQHKHPIAASRSGFVNNNTNIESAIQLDFNSEIGTCCNKGYLVNNIGRIRKEKGRGNAVVIGAGSDHVIRVENNLLGRIAKFNNNNCFRRRKGGMIDKESISDNVLTERCYHHYMLANINQEEDLSWARARDLTNVYKVNGRKYSGSCLTLTKSSRPLSIGPELTNEPLLIRNEAVNERVQDVIEFYGRGGGSDIPKTAPPSKLFNRRSTINKGRTVSKRIINSTADTTVNTSLIPSPTLVRAVDADKRNNSTAPTIKAHLKAEKLITAVSAAADTYPVPDAENEEIIDLRKKSVWGGGRAASARHLFSTTKYTQTEIELVPNPNLELSLNYRNQITPPPYNKSSIQSLSCPTAPSSSSFGQKKRWMERTFPLQQDGFISRGTQTELLLQKGKVLLNRTKDTTTKIISSPGTNNNNNQSNLEISGDTKQLEISKIVNNNNINNLVEEEEREILDTNFTPPATCCSNQGHHDNVLKESATGKQFRKQFSFNVPTRFTGKFSSIRGALKNKQQGGAGGQSTSMHSADSPMMGSSNLMKVSTKWKSFFTLKLSPPPPPTVSSREGFVNLSLTFPPTKVVETKTPNSPTTKKGFLGAFTNSLKSSGVGKNSASSASPKQIIINAPYYEIVKKIDYQDK